MNFYFIKLSMKHLKIITDQMLQTFSPHIQLNMLSVVKIL